MKKSDLKNSQGRHYNYDCPTGKRTFRSRRDANLAKKEAARKFGDPMAAYNCDHCDGWHLSKSITDPR